jgi:hypothetical protein
VTLHRIPPRPRPLVQLSALKNIFPDFAFATVIEETGSYIHAQRIAGTGTLRMVATGSAIEMWRILSARTPSPPTRRP